MVQNRKRRRWGAVCLGLCLLTACQQEIGIDPGPEEGMFLMYNSDVKPLAGTTDKVRAIVFAGQNNSGSKTFVSNTEFTGTSGKIPLQGGKYQDIYMIINEEEDLAGIKTLEQLQNVKINENLSTDVNAIRQRYHYSHNIYVRADGSVLEDSGSTLTELSSSQYTAAKVSVQFDLTPVTGNVSLKFTGAKLIEVPAYSYLIPRTYDGTGYGERNFNLPSHDAPGTPYKHTVEVAVPEYWPPTGGQVMMLVISADRYQNNTRVGSSEYHFQVGNSMTGTGTDNKVDRNKVYKFKFTGITGPGVAVDDWKVGKQVVDSWTEEQVDTEVDGAYGFFLQTELLDNFRAFRMPRYVNFRTEGPGKVWVDVPRYPDGAEMVPNEFSCKVLWNDNSQKSGRLELKVGNWQVGKDFVVHIKMVANNIQRTLIVKCKKTVFADKLLSQMNWGLGMGYQSDMMGVSGTELNKQDVMIEYWSQDGPRNGCAGYYDPANAVNDPVTGRGCWRMATIRESILYMMEFKNYKKEYWAYEPDNDMNRSYYTYSGTPIPGGTDLGPGLPGKYFKLKPRDNSLYVLCILDDKLDIYYNIEVNSADHPTNVDYTTANSICDNLSSSTGGMQWRLPTPEEADYALKNAGTQGIPNNFNAGLYWLNDKTAAGPDSPSPTKPNAANVRCVRKRWQTK